MTTRNQPPEPHPLDTGEWEKFDTDGMRRLYRGIRSRAIEAAGFTKEGFDTAVQAALPPDPTPRDWVVTARAVESPCGKCNGSGVYVWGPQCEFSGRCHACEGSGTQNDDDRRRNWGYWQYRDRADTDTDTNTQEG